MCELTLQETLDVDIRQFNRTQSTRRASEKGLLFHRPHGLEKSEVPGVAIIDTMADVTQIIAQMEQGDPKAAEQLLPLVYAELRRLAAAKIGNEKPGQTLQATALVHEAYLRLVRVDNPVEWNSRGHFFAAAAEAMRRILVDRARNKKRKKRSGEQCRLDLQAIEIAVDTPVEDLLAIDEALDKLQLLQADVAQLVKLRFFVGMSLSEAATALGISRRTAYRRWEFARAWLYQQLHGNADPTAF